jgi:hypothetical protein
MKKIIIVNKSDVVDEELLLAAFMNAIPHHKASEKGAVLLYEGKFGVVTRKNKNNDSFYFYNVEERV